jgi:hypothetical protein
LFRAQHNPDAAPADEKNELLKAGPWCFADDSGTQTLECDGAAQRTQRAGVYELKVSAFKSHAATLSFSSRACCSFLADMVKKRQKVL